MKRGDYLRKYLKRCRIVAGLTQLAGLALALVVASSCRNEDPPPPVTLAAKDGPRCVSGYSEDPPQGELRVGIAHFEAKEYAAAQTVFAAMLERFNSSGTVSMWLGDAVLFDRGRDSTDAARDAGPHYARARRLHDEGCKLPRRPRYYLLMGEAYAALRLAKTADGRDTAAFDRGISSLKEALDEFPTSAEVPYTLARAYCGKQSVVAAVGQDGAESKGDEAAALLSKCETEFERTLKIAGTLERPRFLRTHRSVQDWIVRSRKQSEFEPLRSSPRYEEFIEAALDASQKPLEFGTGPAATAETDQP